MITYTAICPRIYFLPKLHKLDPQNPIVENLKMRPIVSGISSPTSEISHYIANIIKASIDQEKYNIKTGSCGKSRGFVKEIKKNKSV
jgi:hypothetical protein